MNSIWNKNIAAFSSRFPGLAELYKDLISSVQEQDFSFWKISTAKNGWITAQENNINLHSSYNPQREAQQAANQILQKNNSSVIFIGFGLGYQVQELCKLAPEKKLILIEPDPLHFFAALFYTDWQIIFEQQQLVLAVGCPVDSIISLIENSSGQNSVNLGNTGVSTSYVFQLQAFTNHSQEYFHTVQTLIQRNIDKNEINAATYKKFEKLWIRNSLTNLNQLETKQTLSEYLSAYNLQNKNSEREQNFLLVAAGPSLQSILPDLKELKQKLTIVCVETALKSVLAAGIQPDFIVITDPQYYAYRHIAGLSSPQSVLICPLSVYPAVYRFECKQILICSELFPVTSYFEKYTGSFGDLGAGGSVASSCWNLCYMLGAKNIYLAGLDLGFPSKQTHIKGSSAEHTFNIKANRISSEQKMSAGSMYGANPEYGQNYNGEKILTDSRMKMFAWWFESRIAACPNVNTYTLCNKSLKIPGVKTLEKDFRDYFQINSSKEVKQPGTTREQNTVNILENKFTRPDYPTIYKSFTTDLSKLEALINTAVEKCLINSSCLQEELSELESQIKKSSLYSIIKLATPTPKQLENIPQEAQPLHIYKTLQKTLSLYNSSLQK